METYSITVANSSAGNQTWHALALFNPDQDFGAGDDLVISLVDVDANLTVAVRVTNAVHPAVIVNGTMTYTHANTTWVFASPNAASFAFAYDAHAKTVSLSCSV